MAIHQEQVEQIQGFEKEIEASAMGMILDNLQMYQYQYPQKSTVRELVSNALDAVREKQIAISILTGQSKVEDHYLVRQEDLYKDSNFNPDYYDLHWLWRAKEGNTQPPFNYSVISLWNREPHKVYVTYEEGILNEKDRLVIEDYGVGLGGKRLEGYFKLGYSTKRNAKHALGKFGIGAKAALSTAPYYTMISRYNGQEFRFQIYSHRIVSIVPAIDLEKEQPNPYFTLSNGSRVHYVPTDLPNGCTIIVESKKHHKQLYIDAVKSQLLYFDSVVFGLRNEHGQYSVVPTKADVLYEDDFIVLSNNNQFSKPHILINKVNYGLIDFRELELEDKQGNIGIKVEAEDVVVNPSRESLIWNEVTREAVVKKFRNVVDIAGHMIAQQLKETDFLAWVRSCSQVMNKFGNGGDSVLGRLAKIVDLSTAKIKFSRDESVVFSYSLFCGIKVRFNKLVEERKGSNVKYKIERIPGKVITAMAEGTPIYVQYGTTSFARDKYLLQHVHPAGFITIQLSGDEDEDSQTYADPLSDPKYNTVWFQEECDQARMTKSALINRILTLSQYIQESTEATPYESVTVPDDFDVSEEVETKTEEEKATQQIRKRENTVTLHTPRIIENPLSSARTERLYEWQQLDATPDEIDAWDNEEVFYASDTPIGTDSKNNRTLKESDMLFFAAYLTRPFFYGEWVKESETLKERDDIKLVVGFKKPDYRPYLTSMSQPNNDRVPGCYDSALITHYNPKNRVRLIRVANTRRHLFKDFKPIQRFFLDVRKKVLTMSNALIRWNTGRLVNEHLERLKFLNNFSQFHTKYAQYYQDLVNYTRENYRPVNVEATASKVGFSNDAYNQMVSHCDRVFQFQKLVREAGDNPELIAAAAKDLFNADAEIVDACSVDMTVYDKLTELLDYSAPIYTIMNEMPVMFISKDPSKISAALDAEIRAFLSYKNVEMA